MKKFVIPALLVCFSILLIVSCQKGDDGPAGAQGITGPAGATNTLVKKILFSPNWTDGSYMGQTVNKDTLPDADINTNVIDKGGVFVFFKAPDSTQWYPLPYTAGLATRDEYIQVSTQPGQLNLYAWVKDSAGIISNFTPLIDSLKYVIVLDRSITGRGFDLSLLSFEELCWALKIKP